MSEKSLAGEEKSATAQRKEWEQSFIEMERQRRREGKGEGWLKKLTREGAYRRTPQVIALLGEEDIGNLEAHVREWDDHADEDGGESFSVRRVGTEKGVGVYLVTWADVTRPFFPGRVWEMAVRPLDEVV